MATDDIIEGTARDVTPTSVAMTVAPAAAPVQHYDTPQRDPLRALGLMDPAEFTREVEIIKAGTERMLALQAGLLRGPADGKAGIDWDTIPGTPKPSLLQPGAERLAQFHRLIPEHRQQLTITPGREGWPEEVAVHTQTYLHHGSLEGPIVGSAVASCSSYEDRYLYKTTERLCPKCSAPAIIKGKPEYAPRQQGRSGPVLPGYEGGGWVCWKGKKQTPGCGENFPDEDQRIVGQAVGKAFVDNPRGLINTITQISAKRGFVGAIRHTLGITDLFTQDIEEFIGQGGGDEGHSAPPAAENRATPPAQQRAAPPAQQQPPAAAKGGPKGTGATFSGPVMVEPEGMRDTASGKVMNFAIKVGSSKHWVELWGADKAELIPHLKVDVKVAVEGTRFEEDYPNRGDKPKKKVIRDVTAISIDGGPALTFGVAPGAMPMAEPDDGPPPFEDGDVATVARTPYHGDPSESADVTGTIAAWSQQTTGQGTRYLRVEVDDPGAPGRFWNVAVTDLDQVETDDLGKPLWQQGDPIRLIGGRNAKGAVIVAAIVLDPRTETAAPAGKE